ncbi:uncharacterized protein BKA78DRAFT_28417 [Phyllosticta capitalensis]|uniref:uncharacterized protein n=1 Tax=Phyllosticta capitalensis TaxID=121624 RepID=UPI003130ED8E
MARGLDRHSAVNGCVSAGISFISFSPFTHQIFGSSRPSARFSVTNRGSSFHQISPAGEPVVTTTQLGRQTGIEAQWRPLLLERLNLAITYRSAALHAPLHIRLQRRVVAEVQHHMPPGPLCLVSNPNAIHAIQTDNPPHPTHYTHVWECSDHGRLSMP